MKKGLSLLQSKRHVPRRTDKETVREETVRTYLPVQQMQSVRVRLHTGGTHTDPAPGEKNDELLSQQIYTDALQNAMREPQGHFAQSRCGCSNAKIESTTIGPLGATLQPTSRLFHPPKAHEDLRTVDISHGGVEKVPPAVYRAALPPEATLF